MEIRGKYLEGKEPDLPFIHPQGVATSFWIVLLGEIKTFDTFDNDAYGQVISYGIRLLEEQSLRQYAIIFSY